MQILGRTKAGPLSCSCLPLVPMDKDSGEAGGTPRAWHLRRFSLSVQGSAHWYLLDLEI
jgi:hypothetical protein